ncbi:MAG: hypothetical protein MSB11_09750, partial [Prevotella sp.]|nr:hypothetical protein [Prevotella sp.]
VREAFGSFMAISRKIFTCETDCYVSLSMTTLVMLDSKYAPFLKWAQIIIISIIAMLYYDAVSFYKRRNNAGINRVL